MKRSKEADRLFRAMGKVRQMERGKLCQMKGRGHFNHQQWLNGRNVVRYIPRDEVQPLQDAINGYTQFMELVRQYVDEIVCITRAERTKNVPKPPKKSSTRTNQKI